MYTEFDCFSFVFFLKTIFQVMRTLKQIFVNKSLCKNKKLENLQGRICKVNHKVT